MGQQGSFRAIGKGRQCVFIFIYRLLFLPVLCCVLPYYLLRMWRRGGYFKGITQRFGLVPRPKQVCPVWIQAVSVGEMEALAPFLAALKEKDIPVYLTTTTSTAFRLANKKYASLADTIAYFPLDFFVFSSMAWRRIRPRAVCLMESELWPEHLYRAYRRNCPVYLLNARCSDRTFRRYQRFRRFVRPLFSFLTKVCAASALDQQRFRQFCPPNIAVEETGNLKVDAAIAASRGKETTVLSRSDLGETWQTAHILLGASIWPGEEKFLISFYLQAKKSHPQLRLILVPRHVERMAGIQESLEESGLRFCLRTKPQMDCDVYVVNTTGELKAFLPLADLVFIGKSLEPHRGGQTPIEAAALGKPLLYGPHMENFRSICQSLEQAHAAFRGADAEALAQRLQTWLEHPEQAQTYGQAAARWITTQQGATQRTLDLLNLS